MLLTLAKSYNITVVVAVHAVVDGWIVCYVLLFQLILGNCRFVVKLLCGVNDHLVPFIITDMFLKNVDVRNWSSRVRDISAAEWAKKEPSLSV